MKAFLFDVDDTLYDQVQPFARTFYRLYPERNDIDIHLSCFERNLGSLGRSGNT